MEDREQRLVRLTVPVSPDGEGSSRRSPYVQHVEEVANSTSTPQPASPVRVVPPRESRTSDPTTR